MAAVRVKIDVASGLIELEGEDAFVSAYLDRLLPLIEASGLGGVNRGAAEYVEAPVDGYPQDASAPPGNSGEPQPKKRRLSKRAPAGATCRDRILILKGDDFFKEHRSATDIVGGLGKKGWTHNANQVSAALVTMFSSNEIQRTKNDVGRGFSYFWDRH